MNEKTLKKAINGSKKAFKQIYKEYFEGLWRYIYSRCGNKDITADVVADSFLALYESIDRIEYPKAIRSYLYKIAKNKLTSVLSQDREDSVDEEFFDRVVVEEDEAAIQGIPSKPGVKIAVERILETLPERYQEVLRLSYLSGLKIKEIAEIMSITTGNAKVLKHRALKKAQQNLNNYLQ